MTTWGYKSFCSAGICLIFLGSIAAAASRGETTESQSAMPGDQYNRSVMQSQSMATDTNSWSDCTSKGIEGRAGTLQCADKVIGMSVYNKQSDKIGTIKDLIADKNAVSYVILSSGTNYYAVPWTAFHSGNITQSHMLAPSVSTRAYTLDVTKDGLRNAPTISSDDPKLFTSDMIQTAQSFYSRQISSGKEMGKTISRVSSTQDANMSRTPSFFSCKKALGMDIKNDQDQDIADLKDIVFDVRQGNLAYGLINFGGVMGIATKTAAVPWSAIKIQPDQKNARLNADERTLASAQISRDQIAKLNDPTFARQVHQSFGQDPYWEVYGYVPPTAEQGAMGATDYSSDANASSLKRENTSVEPNKANSGTPSQNAEQNDTNY